MPGALALVLWMLLGLLGGASLVIQAGLNAGLRARLESVTWAGFVSYVGGTLAMAAALIVVRVGPPSLERVQSIPAAWWLGGLFGAAYLAVSIVLLPRLGAATVVALIVAGQLGCSLIVDQLGLFGVPRHPFSVPRAIGALLLIGGVVLMRR
jgi:transporter family-2 protein